MILILNTSTPWIVFDYRCMNEKCRRWVLLGERHLICNPESYWLKKHNGVKADKHKYSAPDVWLEQKVEI